LDNFFRKLKNSSYFVRLGVERTHINQKIENFENPTSACQTIVKWCQKLGCNNLKPKPGSNLGYGPQNGVRNGLFTQKLDLWTAFGYMGFSVYGLFGSGAFGYTGFSVVTPL
jgi:hypothetical protein